MATPSAAAAPLPSLTLSQIQGWNTEHLEVAAAHWSTAADRWRDGFTAVSTGITRPGGTGWQGSAADAASARSERDRIQVLGLVDRLHEASSVARSGAAELAAARSRTLASVDEARRSGFAVSEDLSVRDTLSVASKPTRLVRDLQAQVFAADIRAQSTTLAATDQSVASRLTGFTTEFSNFGFPQAPPLPLEPAPPPVPMPPYQPQVWGACKLSGADPNKVVRTFYRAPLTAGSNSMPAGDSVLYCGNDKYGFIHIVDEHGAQWQQVAGSTWPGAGNWRYLADYAISATLANPENVTYDQDRNTFAVYRNIYRMTDDGLVYAFTCRVVVSGSDGKIITAFPSTKPV
jgi:hypothetical protein